MLEDATANYLEVSYSSTIPIDQNVEEQIIEDALANYFLDYKIGQELDFQLIACVIYEVGEGKYEVFQEDANHLINRIKGDILYLDPPYNARQYGANYHLLNTIAEYKTFEPKGVTGLPEYNKSAFCSKATVLQSFTDIITKARFRFVFLSYNNEGLMSHTEILQVLSQYGKVELKTMDYQRFKADKTENRNHKATETKEYLFCLEKES